MKTYLLLTDFSKTSEQAIKYAIQNFGTQGVQYLLLHVYKKPSGTSASLVSVRDVIHSNVESSLELAISDLQKEHEELNIVPIAMAGSLTSVIKHLTALNKVAGVVMGTEGASGFNKLFNGSDAGKVLQIPNINTWVIPAGNETSPKEVTLAVDKDDFGNRKIVDQAEEILAGFEHQLKVVNVVDQPASNSTARFEKVDYLRVEDEDIQHGIQGHIEEQGSNLLVIKPKKKSFLSHFFQQSIASELTEGLTIPLLSLASA